MKKNRIGKGLPRCIGTDNDGFERLCNTLGLVDRQHRKVILKIDFAKQKINARRKALSRTRLKAGERDHELLFELYSDPNSRLELWRKSLDEIQTSEDENHSEMISVPSLEYCILTNHIQNFSPDDNNPDINDVFSEWPEILEQLNEEIPWANFAGYVWSEVKRYLDNWDNLTDDERTQTTLVTFAVATIVNDDRILSAAIQKAPQLEIEFSSLLDDSSDTERVDDPVEEKEIVSQWNAFCESLEMLAAEAAGSPPKVDTLAQIKFTVGELDKMEQSVRDHLATISLESLISRVEEHINDLAVEESFLWLDDTVRKQLKTRWLEVGQSLSLDQIKEEFERLEKKVPNVFKHVHNLATTLSEITQQCDNLRLEEPSNFSLRFTWEKKLYKQEEEQLRIRRKQTNAQIELLSELSPLGESFKPDHDEIVSPPSVETPTPVEEAPLSEKSDINEKNLDVIAAEIKGEDVSVEEIDDVEPIDQPRNTGDAHKEENLENDSKPQKPTTTTSTEGIDIGLRESDGEADTRLNLARTRVIDALLKSPPRLAYVVQVGRLINRLSLNSDLPPVELFEAMLLSDYLMFRDADVAYELKLALQQVLEQFSSPEKITDGPNRDLYVMLVLASTMRPALLSPQSGALAFINALKPSERLSDVYQLINVIIEGCEKLQGVRIDSSILRGADSKTVWQAKRDQLMSDVVEWKKQAPYKTTKYVPATKVWQKWLKPGGHIHKLLSPIASDSDGDVSRVEEKVTELGNRKSFEELVKKTDRLELGRRRGEDIHYKALNQLYTLTSEAVDLANRHLNLNSSKPTQSDFLTNTLADIRGNFENLALTALEELGTFLDTEKSLISGAANSAIYALKRFREILTSGYEDGEQEPDPKEIICSGLFGFSSIHIDDNGIPEGDPEQALDTLLSTGQPEEYKSAFERYLAVGDLKTAKRLANWIEYEDLNDTEDIRNRLDEVLALETQKLRWLMNETRNEVEAGLGRGSISDAERAEFDADLVRLELLLKESKVLRFDLERNGLKHIVETINNSLNSKAEKLKPLLNALSLSPESTEYKQITQSIAQGDLVTANELIDRVRNNESYPIETQPDEQRQVFQDFYPSRSDEIDKELEALRNSKEIIDQIRKSNKFAGMALGDIPGAQRASAAQMLEAWYSLKRTSRLEGQAKASITTLFTGLGFIVQKVRISRFSQNFGEAYIETDPLQARERCPIPAFGSLIKGRYRLVFLWGRPTEEDIIQHAEESSAKHSTIVLYLGRLSSARREGLSRISRERFRTLLVIDELLLVFLCGERDSRMFSLFSCATPFTYVQPYVTRAGLVPPEMFYGREREMQEIANPHGSVFIYGGRQLGKTALLRAVERTSHRPKEGSYAVFIDLKGAGIGYDRDAADIWQIIWRRLREQSVIPDEIKEPNNKGKGRVDEFVDSLCFLFGASSGNSLFILLDEADKFLEVDARDLDIPTKGFRESSRLKALMDRTGRSIKVVFAGLHNVLRTVKGANHPLGHFGQPIEVGPLLSGSGWRSAEELIRQPLLVSGYQFKDDSLVTRILAQTNYYPSLIQLYGSALIKEMCSRLKNGAPLYEIDDKILDQTYQNKNLRDMIRSRFHLTLQLDPRYEVIAYSIANDCIEQEALLGEGIDHGRIDEAVRTWWPEGFEDIEPYTDGLRVLLDEMAGLGVLRAVDEQDARYTLRNPNVLLLMGTKDEIAENLLRNREPPQEFEREHFRARYSQKSNEEFSRSPLTFQQEDILRAERNGISLICGIPAAGFDNVISFLEARVGNDYVIQLKSINEQREFEKELKGLLSKRPDGTTICVIPHGVPWSEKWVQFALEQVVRLSAKGRYLQIVFMTDPQHLWTLQSELKKLNSAGLRWISLRPWRGGFLRHWMDDVGFSNDSTIRDLIIKKTGGWKTLLERLYFLSQESVNLENSIIRLENEFTNGDASRLRKEFALNVPEANNSLKCLLEVGDKQHEATTEQLMVFLDDFGIDEDILQRSLEWAELLHLVHRTGQNAWQLDSIAARALSSIGS